MHLACSSYEYFYIMLHYWDYFACVFATNLEVFEKGAEKMQLVIRGKKLFTWMRVEA